VLRARPSGELSPQVRALPADEREVKPTWFDQFMVLLDRLETNRLILVRDVVNALVSRRLEHARYPNIEAALAEASELHSRRA
jgi:hypothetical protein